MLPLWIAFHLWYIDLHNWLFGLFWSAYNLPGIYKTNAVSIQAIQRIMDSDNVIKMKSGEMFVALYATQPVFTCSKLT